MIRRLLPALLLVLIAACADSGAPEGEQSDALRAAATDSTLPEVDTVHYDIDLALNDVPGAETYRATVKGTYVATKDLTELALDFDGNTIDDVKVGNSNATHTRRGDRLVVKLPALVKAGKTFSTKITYHGAPAQADGSDPNDFAAFGGFMVKQKNSEKKRIYTSLSWPSKARRWLPLRDHPRDTATVSIHATFPKAFTVLANGKRTGTTDNADGSKTWSYDADAPMPTYDFHVTAYEDWKLDESRASAGIPIATYTYSGSHPNVPDIYSDLPAVLDFYSTTFGRYRWGTAAFIQEPIFGGGMEHASVVSMDETLFPDPKGARAVAFHELAHHWSGNSVHIRAWNDFWLSEGFTEYLTARAITEIDGPAAGRTVWHEYLTSTLEADRDNPHPLAPPGKEIDVLSIFDSIPYQKGALTVRMLEHVVGEAKMAAFLKGWFDRHGLGPAVSTDDLQRELEQASGKDLSAFFATVVRAGGHPELLPTFAPAGDETEVTIEQIQEVGPRSGFQFPLDLDLVSDAGTERVTIDLTGKKTTQRFKTRGTVTRVVIDPDEFAVAVASCGQSGGKCKDDFRCAPQRAGVSVCVPRKENAAPARR